MNTDLAKLKQQMATLQPDRLTELTERAAPFIAKAVGYVELVRSLLPPPQRATARLRQPAPPPVPSPALPPAPVIVVRQGWWRTLPIRRYAIGGGLAVAGGAIAYLGWRSRPRAR